MKDLLFLVPLVIGFGIMALGCKLQIPRGPIMNRCIIPLLFSAFLFTFRPVVGAEPPPQGPFKFVATKTETGKLQNVMELYAFSGPINAAELKKLCVERKSKSQAKTILYVVVFDTVTNAKFPSTPFTAEYGIEEDALKHIRALYMFNKVNGFSEVRYHDKNIWDNIPIREKL